MPEDDQEEQDKFPKLQSLHEQCRPGSRYTENTDRNGERAHQQFLDFSTFSSHLLVFTFSFESAFIARYILLKSKYRANFQRKDRFHKQHKLLKYNKLVNIL